MRLKFYFQLSHMYGDVSGDCFQDSLFHVNADDTARGDCSTCRELTYWLGEKNKVERVTKYSWNTISWVCHISKYLVQVAFCCLVLEVVPTPTDVNLVVLMKLWFLYCTLELRGCLHRVPRLWNCNTLIEYSQSARWHCLLAVFLTRMACFVALFFGACVSQLL